MRRGPPGIALGVLGVYLLAQSVRRIETWPQFMSHVQEITPTGERRHRWRVDGPAGIPGEWESEITSEIPDESLSWRTIPGSMVDTEGTLSLENDGPSRTRLNVRMLYHPPAGAPAARPARSIPTAAIPARVAAHAETRVLIVAAGVAGGLACGHRR